LVVVVVGVVVVVESGAVVVVVAVGVVVVVVGVVASSTINSSLFADGAVGVTPVGSKANVTRRSFVNLILAGFVVNVGFSWPNVDQ
jgi:hypothetical protein